MVDYQRIFEGSPALFLVLDADESFSILDASDAYLRATYTERDAIVGRPLFEVFPSNPDDPSAIVEDEPLIALETRGRKREKSRGRCCLRLTSERMAREADESKNK